MGTSRRPPAAGGDGLEDTVTAGQTPMRPMREKDEHDKRKERDSKPRSSAQERKSGRLAEPLDARGIVGNDNRRNGQSRGPGTSRKTCKQQQEESSQLSRVSGHGKQCLQGGIQAPAAAWMRTRHRTSGPIQHRQVLCRSTDRSEADQERRSNPVHPDRGAGGGTYCAHEWTAPQDRRGPGSGPRQRARASGPGHRARGAERGPAGLSLQKLFRSAGPGR